MLTIAFALLSGAADLARVFQSPEPLFAPVTFYFGNRHEEQTFELQDETGAVRTDTIGAFSRFVRCWRTEKVKPMHPRTLEIVTAISRHFGNARVEVVSGYRARPYGAPNSKHFHGRAMDLRVTGVPARHVAAFVWKNFRNIGVGYYPNQEFVHVDTRDLDVRWVDSATHGESAHAKYFTRLPADGLPVDAPRLAYDSPRTKPALTMARLAGVNPAQTLSTIQGMLGDGIR